MHEMKLREKYFNLIKSGEKKYEIRLNDEKRKLIKICDEIKFLNLNNPEEYIICKVEDLVYFKDFEEMTNTLSPESIGMKNLSKTEITDIYHEFYTKQDEQIYSVVAIKVSIL